MTNKERLISLLGFAPPPNAAEGALLDFGIEGEETYTGSNLKPLKKAAISIMEMLLTTADTGNGEPGFTIKYDRAAVLKRIDFLNAELGEDQDKQPIITSKSVW